MPPSAADIEREMKRLTRDLGQMLGTNRSALQHALNVFGSLPDLLKDISSIPDEISGAIQKDYGPLLDQYEKIREVYGDLSKLEADRNTAAGAALGRLETVTNAMYLRHVEIDGMIIAEDDLFQKRLGVANNYLYTNFTQKEAVEAVEGAQANLNVQYANQINHMDQITMLKIPAYTKGMKLSASDVGEVMRISILRTGEASTDMLDKISAYSQAISRKTGIPMHFLNQSIADVITNIKLYGDIQEEEAARIVSNVTQLGLKYDALAETQQKFGKFSGATDNIGKISQITGVQLDAQRIAFLSATGKMDEALLYMKDQFKNQGFTKEDFQGMTLPLRNALSDVMVGGQEGVMNLLDMEKPFEDMADTIASTDTTNAFKTVTDNLSPIEGYADKAEKALERLRIRGLLPNARDAHAAAAGIRDVKEEISKLDLPAKLNAQTIGIQNKFLTATIEGSSALKSSVEKIVDEQVKSYAKNMSQNLGPLWDSATAETFQKSGFQRLNKYTYSTATNSAVLASNPESQLQQYGAYLGQSVADSNRPLLDETITLVKTTQTNAQLQAEKDALYIKALDEHALTMKEGQQINLHMKIVDTNGNLISQEDIQAIKDFRNMTNGKTMKIGGVEVQYFASTQPK